MTNPPKISLITCTKNSGRWLAECVASIKAQSYQPFEYIIIDAHSSDNTITLIKQRSPQALIFQQKGSGLYDALNEGISRAGGDIIGFLHADDVFADSEALERIAKAFQNNPQLGFYCSRMEVYDEQLQKPFAILGAPPHLPTWQEELYSSNYFAHPTYYCSRETIARVGKYSEHYKIAGDIDWLIRLEKSNLPFYFDKKVLLKFRSSSGVSSTKYLLALKEEYEIRKKYNGISLRLLVVYGWHFFRRIVRLVLENCGLNRMIMKIRKIIFSSAT